MSKWLFLVKGPADTDFEGCIDDDGNPVDAAIRKQLEDTPLALQVEKYLESLGFRITERGKGFGEWEVGFMCDNADELHAAYSGVLAHFRKAWLAKLLYGFMWPIQEP